MIYRLLSNESNHLSLMYDDDEVITKIGSDYLIQADPSPIRFATVWQKVTVSFVDSSRTIKLKTIPDVQHHFGHLFLSDKAVQVLKPILIV